MSDLPIDDILPDLAHTLSTSSSVVIEAPPGAGKTTRVPPALDTGAGHVLVVEPRRIAARSAAERMAFERGEAVGESVGYQVRFDRKISPRTRISVVTEGILLRKLQADPFLEPLSAVVFDEFHERNLQSDVALAMLRQVQQMRDDLKVVVMSATLDVQSIAHYLGDCPVLSSRGRRFPVEIAWQPRPRDQPLEQAVARGVERVLRDTDGDVLVFLPGKGEIQRATDALRTTARAQQLELCPLHGGLKLNEQARAIRSGERRKVVLATNVAETSLTVEGVTAVVDAGLVRTMRLDLGCGLPRLELERISSASAEQRAGRAGRLRPGVALRLWSEAEHAALADYDTPEIQRVDLAGTALQLLAWGERNLHTFPWFEPPEPERLNAALSLLHALGATNPEGLITPLGKHLATLPVHPRLARLLIEGSRLGHGRRAALLAAMLSERDPFHGQHVPVSAGHESDIEDRLVLLERQRASSFLIRAAKQFERVMRGLPIERTERAAPDEAMARALLTAFPDRVAKRRAPRDTRALMVGGRGVRLGRDSRVHQAELMVCVDLDAGSRGERAEAWVRKASAVNPEWLPEEACSRRVDLLFDPSTERVTALERWRFLDLILDEQRASVDDPLAAAERLAEAASTQLEHALNLDRFEPWLTRVRWLAKAIPELEIPSFDDAELIALLPILCAGKRSFAELRRAPLQSILAGSLSHAQRQALARHAPERIQVPSGSHIRLRYSEDEAPVLAVRIQELFGLTQTPRVAQGRVPVTLHLLAPNQRPQQVTNDLAGFWERTYPEVRKELRARYAKHAWPEDPLTARAERRPRRKR